MKYRYRARASERPVANHDIMLRDTMERGSLARCARGLMDGRVFVDDVYGHAHQLVFRSSSHREPFASAHNSRILRLPHQPDV